MVEQGEAVPVVKVVVSRRLNDCVICALSSYTGVPYEDLIVAAAQVDVDHGKRGLFFSDAIKVAAICGVQMKKIRADRVDLEQGVGVLRIVSPKSSAHPDHAVVLKRGQILDNDGTATDVDVYLANMNAKGTFKTGCMLVLKEE